MATINRLVTQLAVDPSPMEQGFAQGLGSASRFADALAPLIANGLKNPARFSSAGEVAAQKVLDAMNAVFKQDQSTLREALARGSLSPEQFDQLGQQGAKAYNTGLLNAISQLQAHNAITPETKATLINALKDAGVESGEAFGNGLTRIGDKLRSLGRDFVQFGIEASLIITAPLVEGARKAIEAAEDISHATDKIAVSTGAVGPQLDSLGASFDKLFSTLPNSAADIAKALAGINTATGATGPQLEALATQVLNLSRITGTDLGTNIDSSARAFKAWGTSIADQASNLDFLFTVGQRTGTSVSSLSDTLGHFAPALKQFGLSFQQSAALVGEFSKNGIDADAILTTLQTSLSKFAEKGIDGAHALQLVNDSLKNATSGADATNLASRLVGPRLAAQLANAARSGALDFQALTDSVRASGNSINDTATKTDAYGQAVGRVGHASEIARQQIGENLEKAFELIAPLLTSLAQGLGEVARLFNELPRPISAGITLLLGFAAIVGPTAIALAGLSRAAGAVALAIGILSKVGAASAVASVGEAAAGATAAVEGAAVATGGFGAALAALAATPAVVIAGVITAIILVFEHFTRAAREAAESLDDFKKTAKTLSQTQIDIDTTHIRERLAAVNAQAATVQTNIDSLSKQQSRTGSTNGALGDAIDQQDQLRVQAKLLTDELAVLQGQSTKNADAMNVAAAETAAFKKQVVDLVTAAGTGITIDPKGNISGSITDLQNRAKELHSELDRPIEPPNFNAALVTSALDAVEKKSREIQNAGGPGLGAIFDQLSPDVETAAKQVEALVQQVQALPHAFQQLANVRLNLSILRDLDDLKGRLKAIGDTATTLDADKLRASIHSLEQTLAAQIGGPQPGSSGFEIDIHGNIKAITVDPAAGAKLLEVVSQQLEQVHTTAEAAVAAEVNLQAARSSGDLQRVADATVAVQGAYATARQAQDVYRDAVERTHASVAASTIAIKTMLQTASETGANQSAIDAVKVGLADVSPEEVTRVHDDIVAALDKFGPIALQVVPVANRVAIERIAKDSQDAISRAQLLALAGDSSAATQAASENVDRVARSLQLLAQQAQGSNVDTVAISIDAITQAAKDAGIPLATLQEYLDRLTQTGQRKLDIDLAGLAGDADKAAGLQAAFVDSVATSVQELARAAAAGRVGAFDQLQALLKSTGVSAAQVEAALEKMTRGSQILQIASAFKEVTNSILGAQSAVGAFVDSLVDAVGAGSNLEKAINKVQQQNAATRAGNGTVDVLANAAALAGPIGQAISAGFGLLKSLNIFGESATQKEDDAIRKQNTLALQALTVSLDRNTGTAGQFDKITKAILASQQPSNLPDQSFLQKILGGGQESQEDFTKFLHSIGLTFAEVNAQAKTLGITLSDGHGNLTGLNDFMKALKQDAIFLGTLGTDLETQQKILSVSASIAGGTQTAQQKLTDQVNALAATLDSQGGTLGKSLQAAAADGPAALRAALSNLLKEIESGFFTTHLDQLGGLKDVSELLDALGGTADSLNALSTAAGDVTDALLNVPAGFKRALVEFNAQNPQNGPTVPSTPAQPGVQPPLAIDPKAPGTGSTLLDIVKQLQDSLTNPLAKAVTSPVDAMQRLTVSATDVADALDKMFHMKQSASDTSPGTSSNPIVAKATFDPTTFGLGASGLSRTKPATDDQALHIHGDVYVDARDKPASELFDVVKKQGQKVAHQTFGDSTRVADVLAR